MMRRLVLVLAVVAAGCSNQASGSNSVERPFHVVQAGETWAAIAAEHSTTADALQVANNAAASTSNTAQPLVGRYLILPVETPQASTTTTPPPVSTTTQPATTTSVPATTVPPATTSTVPAAQPRPTTTSPPQPSAGAFVEDFSTEASLGRFTWQISHGDVDPFPRSDQPRSWSADHDMACSAPPTVRTVELAPAAGPGPVSVTGGGAFWCAPGADPAKGHVMTSTELTAYGHIDFAPSRAFTNVTRVCWDMNRSDLGGRKWAQVSIIPEAAFHANAGHLDYVRPNLETDVAAGGPDLPVGAFQLSTFRSEVLFSIGDGRQTGADLSEAAHGMFGKPANDRATRYRHCLVDGPNGVTLTVIDPRSAASAADDDPWTVNQGARFHFPQGAVRVIFQDVTYDSIKGDWERGGSPHDTNTWHWDNVLVESG